MQCFPRTAGAEITVWFCWYWQKGLMDSASIMKLERDRFRTFSEASTVSVERTESSLSKAEAVRGYPSFFTW